MTDESGADPRPSSRRREPEPRSDKRGEAPKVAAPEVTAPGAASPAEASPVMAPGPALRPPTRPHRTPDGEDLELITEEPLLIDVGGSRLVTMRTPGHDEDLVRGFLISERIVPELGAIRVMRRFEEEGVEGLAVTLPEGVKARGGKLTRVHEIRASCGLCGAPSVEGIAADLPELRPGTPRITVAEAAAAAEAMRPRQEQFKRTGGSHAAGLWRHGELVLLREDVGRHNAVDKLIGAALVAGIPLGDAMLVLSGRGGFELIMKGLRVGIPIMASVSAPTSFAVELAEEAGATLLGFARGRRATVYCDDGRVEG